MDVSTSAISLPVCACSANSAPLFVCKRAKGETPIHRKPCETFTGANPSETEDEVTCWPRGFVSYVTMHGTALPVTRKPFWIGFDWDVNSRPPYSPDLAPVWLSLILEPKGAIGRKNDGDTRRKRTSNTCKRMWRRQVLMRLAHGNSPVRHEKCVQPNGVYVEKQFTTYTL